MPMTLGLLNTDGTNQKPQTVSFRFDWNETYLLLTRPISLCGYTVD